MRNIEASFMLCRSATHRDLQVHCLHRKVALHRLNVIELRILLFIGLLYANPKRIKEGNVLLDT